MSEIATVEKQLQSRLSDWQFALNERQKEQFRLYYENLVEWNQVMNLTAITDPEGVYEKHFLDSLAVVLTDLPTGAGKRWADIGTGAGFPGLPIAIAFPELQMVLVDSLRKRVRFLEDTVQKLELTNVAIYQGRAEDLGRQAAFREQFDVACSRAVANMSTLVEYTLPFVRVNGVFLAYKTAQYQEEVSQAAGAIRLLGGSEPVVQEFSLPGTEYQRSLIQIRKIHKTPGKYPRKAGTPSKEPLR